MGNSNNIELDWLAELLGITPNEAAELGVDECSRRVRVPVNQNPFDIAFQG